MADNYFVLVALNQFDAPSGNLLTQAMSLVLDNLPEGNFPVFHNVGVTIGDKVPILRNHHVLVVSSVRDVSDDVLQAIVLVYNARQGDGWVASGISSCMKVQESEMAQFKS